MVTVDVDPPSGRPKLDSLTHVDISSLSQSELHSLSLCSDAAFDLRRSDDVVIPKIDRSIFNESAGSRRQTYSRLRLAPRKPETTAAGHRRRFAGLLPTPKPPPISPDDPERTENKSIVKFLKQFIATTAETSTVDKWALTVVENADAAPKPVAIEMPIVVNCGERKRKRGRKPKVKVQGNGGELEEDRVVEIFNRNGVVVDLSALANAENPYGDELKRRTVGLETEPELLGFLRDLEGQWGSRRKKRKIVDASDFGDALPIGWKLLIGLKRREGRVSLYCRRYISPNGQQFVSCKEASSYLQSYFGLNDANQPIDHRSDNVQQPYRIASGNHAGFTHEDNNVSQEIICNSTLPCSSISNQYEKEVTLLGIDNLAEVQVRDLFECHKCDMTFDEKDTYLQHLLSSHQRTTRRYRLGTSVGDGVIVKDGKYECQFCHKIFQERRRYNGHVGIHVRNYVRSFDDLPGGVTVQKSIESSSRDGLPSRISKMDALIEIAQNSMLETSIPGPNDEPKGGSTPNKLNVVSIPEIPAANSDHELNLGSRLSEPEMEDSMIERTPDQELNQQDIEYITTDEEKEKIKDAGDVVDIKTNSCLDATTALSANVQNGGTSETSDKKDGLAFTINEIDKSGIELGGGFQSPIATSPCNFKFCGVENNMNEVCNITTEHSKLDEMETYESSELEIGLGSSHTGPDNDVVTETIQKTAEENVLQSGVADSSMPLMQLLHRFPTFNTISDKVDEYCSVDQKLDNVTGFEELRLDEIEPLKFSFMTGQESLSLPEVSMDLGNDAEMEGGFDSSVRFESDAVMLNMVGRHQLTTLCVWCRMEFNHEAVDSEMQSDSVGFMCPTCKAKISGQLNVLDSGLSMNSRLL